LRTQLPSAWFRSVGIDIEPDLVALQVQADDPALTGDPVEIGDGDRSLVVRFFENVFDPCGFRRADEEHVESTIGTRDGNLIDEELPAFDGFAPYELGQCATERVVADDADPDRAVGGGKGRIRPLDETGKVEQ